MNRDQMEAHLTLHGWEPISTRAGRSGFRNAAKPAYGTVLDKHGDPMEILPFWHNCQLMDEFIWSDKLFWKLVSFARSRFEDFPR